MDCLFQTSLACTAHRQTESFSGWVLSDNLPGCSLEKIIRHTELEFVESFYFILSIHSVLLQQSSGWISTPIKIPYFQEFISCLWKEREQDTMCKSGAPGMKSFALDFKKQTKPERQRLFAYRRQWCWVAVRLQPVGTGDITLCNSERLAICACAPSSPRSARTGGRRGPFTFRRAAGLQGDTNAWTACLLWSLSWYMIYST